MKRTTLFLNSITLIAVKKYGGSVLPADLNGNLQSKNGQVGILVLPVLTKKYGRDIMI